MVELKLFENEFGGHHWIYVNSKEDELSVICHKGSYDGKSGLFEIMPSWNIPKKYGGVIGYLTFEEVSKWIKKLEKREK